MQIKVSEQGNIIEITRFITPVNHHAHIMKLSADEYMTLSDGEIHQYEHIENRSNLKSSLYKTFRRIRALINTNFTGDDSELFVTLTYAENMLDVATLYLDFNKFWKRFIYRYGKAEYISVAEPQARGAWHLHILVKFGFKAPFIPNDELAAIWGKGFVNVRKLRNVDNVGAYLSAYLADAEVPLDCPDGIVKEFPDGTKKKYIKGGRLHMYPPGMNIYRCSRGIKAPDEYFATLEMEKSLVQGLEPTYANTVKFETEEGFSQVIEKYYYNRKRPAND